MLDFLTSSDFLAGSAVGLTLAIVILRVIAPLTKTTKDDKVLEGLEEVADLVGHKVPTVTAPTSNPVAYKAPGPTVVDHRHP